MLDIFFFSVYNRIMYHYALLWCIAALTPKSGEKNPKKRWKNGV